MHKQRQLTNDYEGEMAKAQLLKIENYAKKLNDMIHPEDELEAWVQAKLSVIAAYMGDVKHYLDYQLKEAGQIIEKDDIDDLLTQEYEAYQAIQKEKSQKNWDRLESIKEKIKNYELGEEAVGNYHKPPKPMPKKMHKGGRIYKSLNKVNSFENWGKQDLYPIYDNNLDLVADVADYYKSLASELGQDYASEMKQDLIKVLQTGKITYNDNSTLTFKDGGETMWRVEPSSMQEDIAEARKILGAKFDSLSEKDKQDVVSFLKFEGLIGMPGKEEDIETISGMQYYKKGGGVSFKDRSERDSIRLAKEYQKVKMADGGMMGNGGIVVSKDGIVKQIRSYAGRLITEMVLGGISYTYDRKNESYKNAYGVLIHKEIKNK